MKKVWLIFQIDNQSVYQIQYNGCMGMHEIEAYKEMIAREYKVCENKVKITFDDEIVKTTRVVNYKVKKEAREFLDAPQIKN